LKSHFSPAGEGSGGAQSVKPLLSTFDAGRAGVKKPTPRDERRTPRPKVGEASRAEKAAENMGYVAVRAGHTACNLHTRDERPDEMELPGTDRITNLLTNFLDVQSRRAEVVANNLANGETPGFAAQELDFSDYLKRAAREALVPAGAQETKGFADSPRVIKQDTVSSRLDGNNVDAAREMATLAEAGGQYLTGVQLIQSRLRTLRAAIREGR
jgi:flagellar basal-body rod protein FlgB